jgi:hypothetical protein
MFKKILTGLITAGAGILNFFIAECNGIIDQDPSTFASGVYAATKSINASMTGLCSALLVIFCLMNVLKSAASLTELKRPEVAVKIFIRLILAEAASVESFRVLELIFSIFKDMMGKITGSKSYTFAGMPAEVKDAIDDMSLGAQAGTLALVLVFLIVSIAIGISILITVYTRFFKMFMYGAFSSVPLTTFASESTQSIGISFLKSYAGVCAQGFLIVLSFFLFSAFAGGMTAISPTSDTVMNYMISTVVQLFTLKAIISTVDAVSSKMLGL